MIFLLVCILLASALVALVYNKRKIYMLLSVLCMAVLLAAGYGLLANPMLGQLQSAYIEDEPISWSSRNAIILLGAGTEQIVDSNHVEAGFFSYGRIMKTAQLYLACKQSNNQCKVIITGGDPLHHSVSEAEIYSAVLQKSGVDKNDIELEKVSKNTWQNAKFTAALLRANKFTEQDRLLLVTSGTHMRRSLLYFSHFGVNAKPVRADYLATQSNSMPITYNMMLTDLALHEYLRIWQYSLYDFLGWNEPAQKNFSTQSTAKTS